MKNLKQELKNNINDVLSILLMLVLLLVLSGKDKYVPFILNWAVSIISGLITTSVSQRLVQNISGDYLEKILLNVQIGEKKYSASLFILTSMIVKYFIFKGG